jgi:hypothetical protein
VKILGDGRVSPALDETDGARVVHFNLRYERKSATENYRGLLRMDDGVSTKAQCYLLGPKMKLVPVHATDRKSAEPGVVVSHGAPCAATVYNQGHARMVRVRIDPIDLFVWFRNIVLGVKKKLARF